MHKLSYPIAIAALFAVFVIGLTLYDAHLSSNIAQKTENTPSQITQNLASQKAAALEALLGVQQKLDARGLEGPAEVIGELIVGIGENFDTGEAFHDYFVQDTKSGKVYEILTNEDLLERIPASSIVRVRGNANSNSIEVGAALSSDGTSGVELIEEPVQLATAENRTALAMLGNYSDKNLGCTVSQVDAMLFSGTGMTYTDAMQEVSNGTLTTTGETTGVYNMSCTSDYGSQQSCWRSELQAAAQADGYNTSSYDHLIHVLPRSSNSGLGGYAYYNNAVSFIFACQYPLIYQHELGHNLGMAHASNLSAEYGDNSDYMGTPSYGRYHNNNAPHKDQKQWIPSNKIVTGGAGTYTIDSLDLPASQSTNPQMIKIAKADTNEYYYISLRTPINIGDGMPALYQNMVNIHRYRGSGISFTYFLQALAAGSSFNDTTNGISVLVNSINGNTANVTIGAQCSTNVPTLSVTPNEIGGAPGDTVSYSATLRNNDSSNCGSSNYSFSASAPTGFSTGFSIPSAMLSPGQSISSTLSVTAPTSGANDSNTINVTASGGSGSASDSVLFTMDSTAPSVPSNVQALVPKNNKQVQVSWNSSSDNVGVVGYAVYRNGTYLEDVTGTSYNDRFAVKGTNSYVISAFDAAGNVSNFSSPATVNFSGGSSGSGGTDGGTDTGDSGKPQKCSPWPECKNAAGIGI